MMISPGLDVPDVFRPHEVEGAGLRGHHPAAVEPAEGERSESPWVADGDDAVPGQHDDAVGALHPGEGLCQRLLQPLVQMGGHQVDDHLAVHRGLEDRPPLFELRPQFEGVDQVSVVGEGVVLVGMVDQKGLGVGEDRRAGRGIADMADRQASGELREDILAEHLRGEPHPLVLPDLAAVRRGDSRALLSPVLEREQAEEGHPRRLFVAVHRKDAALLTRPVLIPVSVHDHTLFTLTLLAESPSGDSAPIRILSANESRGRIYPSFP